VTSDGGALVTIRGVCWSTAANPTTGDPKTNEGTGPGVFTSTLSGLAGNTTYHVRAYATNSIGTAYGNEASFTTDPLTVTDIDGNVYNVIRIGTQLWMKENMKTTSYNNGDLIGTTTPATLDISAESAPKYQWAYDGNESNVVDYGRLYTWYAIADIRGVCPIGWHVPSDVDWLALTNYLGGEDVAGGKLKETGTTHWLSPNTGATNETGFSALPGAYRLSHGVFEAIGSRGDWWSSTESDATAAWKISIGYLKITLSIYDWPKNYGQSVRCLRY